MGTFAKRGKDSDPLCRRADVVKSECPDRRRAPAGTTTTNRLRTSDRVTNPAPIRTTSEGGGYMLACACLWIRFATSVNDAAECRREHEKKCKVARGEGE